MLRAISSAIRDHGKDYWTGTIYTTNRRVWEYDNDFKEYLRSTHATGIDMETATLLTAGFANQIPTGALLMISDKPMEEDRWKNAATKRKEMEILHNTDHPVFFRLIQCHADNGAHRLLKPIARTASSLRTTLRSPPSPNHSP